MLAGCNIERNIYCDLAVVFASATSFDAAFKQTVAILSQHLKARYYGSLLPVSSFPDGFIPSGSTGSASIYYANLIQGFPGGHALIPSIFIDKRLSWQTKQIKSLVMVPRCRPSVYAAPKR